jgi:hypothetical protein
MQISVLATKCRFCGEEVGKPKDESRKLSIHDLGGEHVYHRAPSGSVMEALESFRVEETLSSSSPTDELNKLDLGMDPLPKIPGAEHTPSAFDVGYRPPPAAGAKKKQERSGSRVGLVVAVITGIGVLAAAVTAGPRIMESLGKQDTTPKTPPYVNRAPGILRSGGPAINALEAAVDAIQHEDTAENRGIAEDAVAALEKEVSALLNASPFDAESLNHASGLASRGAVVFPDVVTQRLAEETKEDNRVYKMVLMRIDRPTDTAFFKLIEAGSPEVSVREKDTISGRFSVRSIVGSRSVTLIDTKRGNRPVMYVVGSSPMPVK